jgi:hypothetical protein
MAEPYEWKQEGNRTIAALKSDWERLRPVRQNNALGPAAGRAFCEYLWPLANHAPGRLKISTRQMGAEFGFSPQAADNWIATLLGAGQIQIFDRDKKRGTVDLYVFDPDDEVRIAPVDPQKTLDFADDQPPPEPPPATLPMTQRPDTPPVRSPEPVTEPRDSVTPPVKSPEPVTEPRDSVTPDAGAGNLPTDNG